MSWLGGSISSLTGQLTNLTKDILTEGTEEVSDHATELRLAQEKLNEIQTTYAAQKSECERLKKISHQYEENAESAELQINAISREYRMLLEEKEKEIKELKRRHHEMLEEQAKAAVLASSDTVELSLTHSASSPLISSNKDTGYDGGFQIQDDSWEFGDSISLQHEVNRLSHEISRLQAECQHWRSVASQLGQSGTNDEQVENKNDELVELQATVQDLKKQLSKARDYQQHEVTSLQDVHTQKISALKKKHKQEVGEYKQQIAYLEQVVNEGRDSDSIKNGRSSNLPEADRAELDDHTNLVESLRQELSTLHNNLSVVTKEKEEVVAAKQHLEGDLQELRTEFDKLKTDRDEYLKKTEELGNLVSQLKEDLKNTTITEDVLKEEIERLQRENVELVETTRQQLEVKENISSLESKSTNVTGEVATIVEGMGSSEQQHHTAELMNTMEKENMILKEQTLKLQEQVTLLEKASQQQVCEKSQCEDTIIKLREELLKFKDSESTDTCSTLEQSLETDLEMKTEMSSDISELSQKNTNIHDQNSLQAQVDRYKEEVDQFELVKSDWLMEKEALEDVLLQLREQLQEKEMSLNEALAQKLDLEKRISELEEEVSKMEQTLKKEMAEKSDLLSRVSDLEHHVMQLTEARSTVQQEKLDLESSLEELDLQHQEATEKLIQMKDNLLTDISSLQDQVSQRDDQILQLREDLESSRLQTSRDEADSSKLKTPKENEDESEGDVDDLQRNIEELARKNDGLKSELNVKQREIEDLKEKGRRGAAVVNELHMDKQDLEMQLSQSKQDIESKVSKIKELREENTKLISVNKNLTERLQEMEQDLEDWQQVNEDNQLQRVQSERDMYEMKRLETENAQLTERLEEIHQTSSEIQIKNTELIAENDRLSILVNESEKLFSDDAENMIESLENKISILETQLDAVMSEKIALQKDVDNLEVKLDERIKHYESYIQDLQNSKDLDAGSVKNEHQNLLESCHTKKIEITELKSHIKSLEGEIDDIKETLSSSVDSQNQLSEILTEKQNDFDNLKEENNRLTAKCDENSERLKEQDILIESMKNLETQLAVSKTECQRLRMEIEQAKADSKSIHDDDGDDKPQTLEIITELEKELTMANNTLVQLRVQVSHYENVVADMESQVVQLHQESEDFKKSLEHECEKCTKQNDLILTLQEESAAKDDELADLQQKLSHALSTLADADSKSVTQSPLQNSASESKSTRYYGLEKSTISDEFDGENKKEISQNHLYDNYNEADFSESCEEISREMDELRGKLMEKDQIIDELQTNNFSLLKMLDSKSPSSENKTILEINKLENEVKSLKMEKEQILAVMNEKTRECSSSKAEIHRLMSVITAEKSALEKLQRDNHQLNQPRDSTEKEDMQREALQSMSRLVRDREMEIDALKQKNETLLEVLQNSSSENSHERQIHSLLLDKENLGKQVQQLQNEREQMIGYLNQKHQESVSYHNEIQRLNAYVNAEKETFDTLQQDYARLVPQFEDKKQALLKAQNELLNYEQKYRELEVKYGEVIQKANVSETVDIVTFNSKEEELKRSQDKLEELAHGVHEKDNTIKVLTQKVFELENSISDKDTGRTNLKKQVENLTFQLQGLQAELDDLNKELAAVRQKSSEQSSENQMLNELNNQMTLSLRERESELASIREKSGTLQTLLHTQQGEKGQVDHMIQENETLHNHCVQLQQERDQIMLALKQRQKENEELMMDIEKLKDREHKVNRELDRLRQHLLQIEDAYTQEALEAEEREKDLRNRLAVAEEKLLSSSSAIAYASQAASQQVESLQQQLYSVSSQRDAAYSQLTTMQDQCQQYSVSLANLQMVLEQFQKEKDLQVATETERYVAKIKSLTDEVSSLKKQLRETQAELEEASNGLEAAARLSEQLDRREEAIIALKEEVLLRESALKVAEEEIKKLTTSTEAKIDKLLMKNMLLGYFTTPQNKRKEVFHMIGSILNFTQDEFEKVDSIGKQGWVSGFLHLGTGSARTTPPTTPVRQIQSPGFNQSFSQLFVKFLERESSPPLPPVRLPAEDMARELQEKHKEKEAHKPAFNPFTAPRHVSMPLHVGHQASTPTSHILMASGTPSALPLFQPMSEESISRSSSGRSTPQNASAILKDVLGSR
ncbi:thyroid receptor-interacting protein 11-like isoform X2 [Gigantopelta aegis]|uniref:thyroid receptor-interacting protein 11-like isoform X2 n=1 Tax=Gigantopelta aegis TaxID=1735272 RepID=UPI001B889575|nr:thyroid receptor-interacting protein 11-like isoform X2 [Gigantopelta aegis]